MTKCFCTGEFWVNHDRTLFKCERCGLVMTAEQIEDNEELQYLNTPRTEEEIMKQPESFDNPVKMGNNIGGISGEENLNIKARYLMTCAGCGKDYTTDQLSETYCDTCSSFGYESKADLSLTSIDKRSQYDIFPDEDGLLIVRGHIIAIRKNEIYTNNGKVTVNNTKEFMRWWEGN